MLKEVIECVPNFSTSDPKVVEAILNEIRETPRAYILDYTYDDYYNRLVVSFVGDKESVLEAMLKAADKAIELIDMRKHKGQHPRIGAVDVVPFIPIKNVTIHEPRKDEVVSQVTHTDSFTYQLGKLKAGKYIFQVYVQTVHGSQDYWLENEIEFTVSSCSLDAAPEFSAYQPLLLMLALTSLILVIKKLR